MLKNFNLIVLKYHQEHITGKNILEFSVDDMLSYSYDYSDKVKVAAFSKLINHNITCIGTTSYSDSYEYNDISNAINFILNKMKLNTLLDINTINLYQQFDIELNKLLKFQFDWDGEFLIYKVQLFDDEKLQELSYRIKQLKQSCIYDSII